MRIVVPSIVIIIFVSLLSACGSTKRYEALPANLENQVEVPGFHNIRSWGDVHSPSLEESATLSIKQEIKANQGKALPALNALALSGGGADGAFGAGFLCGWSKSGKRPTFKLVTGISTGALIAPLAFLGPRYDAQLKEAYTTISDQDVYKPHSLFSIALSLLNIQELPSMASTKPFERLIAKQITMKLFKEVAAEHRKGRRLLVGTSQMNAQRLVIWDMGAIANSNSPKALPLFRKILLASASLPVSFPPQYFDVTAGAADYQELHVDGGIEAQVMLYENAITPFASARKAAHRLDRPRHLYIIRNQKIYGEWEYIQPQLKYIALRSIDTLTKSQGIGDIYRLYTYAKRDDIQFNLVFIPKSFTLQEKTPFDKVYMQKLFALGYRLGQSKDPWSSYPPEYDPA